MRTNLPSILGFGLGTTALLATALTSTPSAAYSITAVKWASASYTISINPAMAFFAGNEVTAFRAAITTFNQNASTSWLASTWDTDMVESPGNGVSEMTMTADNALLCGSMADGCTSTYWNSSNALTEADIYMDSTCSWDYLNSRSANIAYGGTKRPFQTTALHEIGHSMGLGHVNSLYNLMGEDYTFVSSNNDTMYSDVGEDATSGLRALYGSMSSGYEDLALSHWRYSYADGQYSRHARTRLYNSSSVELTKYSTALDQTYSVTKGSSIQAEVTIENNGTVAQYNYIKFYVSTDRTISTSDTLLSSSYMYASPDSPLTSVYTTSIPSTLTSGGTYYLGAIVDPTGSLTEVNENNNAVYLSTIRVN